MRHISKRYVNGSLKEFINDPNPDYVPDTAKYVQNKINHDVTPNYKRNWLTAMPEMKTWR